jgi:Arc/MetJ-type ribon-helix-helix transcriptional regulator
VKDNTPIAGWGVTKLGRKLCVDLPAELVDMMREVIEVFGFGSEEEFIKAAVRRLLDKYMVLIEGAAQNR